MIVANFIDEPKVLLSFEETESIMGEAGMLLAKMVDKIHRHQVDDYRTKEEILVHIQVVASEELMG